MKRTKILTNAYSGVLDGFSMKELKRKMQHIAGGISSVHTNYRIMIEPMYSIAACEDFAGLERHVVLDIIQSNLEGELWLLYVETSGSD